MSASSCSPAGGASAAERHQTLRATIDWSYAMLDERSARCSTASACSRAASTPKRWRAVAAGDGLEAWDVLDAGAGLVAKSMIVADEASGTTRYQMLETLRAFAREQLEARDELARHVPAPCRALHAVRGGGRRRARRTRRGRVAHAGAPGVRQPPRRVRPVPDPRRGRRRAGARCASSPRSRSRRSTTAGLGIGGWAEHLVPGSISRRRPCAPRCSRRRRSARRVATTSTPCASSPRRHCATGYPRTARARCGRSSRVAANEGMAGDWDAAIRVIADAEAALRAAGDSPRGLSFLVLRRRQLPQPRGRLRGSRARRRAARSRRRAARRTRPPPRARSSRGRSRSAATIRGRLPRALDESIELGRRGTSGGLLGFALARRSVMRADAGDLAGAAARRARGGEARPRAW